MNIMSESKSQKKDKKDQDGSSTDERLEEPFVAHAAPTDIAPTFSFGPPASPSEIKPFSLSSKASGNAPRSNVGSGLRKPARQTRGVGNGRRSKPSDIKPFVFTSGSAGASSTIASSFSENKPFAFTTNSADDASAAASERKKPFVFGSESVGASSTVSTESVLRASTSSTPRQRTPSNRRVRRKQNISRKADAGGATNNNSGMSATTKDNGQDCENSRGDSKLNMYQAIRRGDIREDIVCEEPKGSFSRASASELRQRRIVRVRKDNRNSNADASATNNARKDHKNGDASTIATIGARHGLSNSVARALGNDSEGGDDSLPPLLDAANKRKDEEHDEEESDEDDSEKESEEEENSDAPVDEDDLFRRIAAGIVGQVMGGNDDSGDDDSDDVCMCDDCVMHRNRSRAVADYDSDESDGDSDELRCCICFNRPSPTNIVALLPCCGSKSGEETSTTRFCNACVVECLKSQNAEMMSALFDYQIDNHYVGECPRCRSVISISRRDSFSTSRNDIIKGATFRLAVRHALRDPEKGMRPILYTACCVYPYYMPAELFDNEVEKTQQLCRWGILREVRKGQVYAIDPKKQEILKNITEARFEDNGDPDESTILSPAAMIVMRASVQLFHASFCALTKFKIIVSLRMFNQGIAIFLVGVGALPSGLHRPWQGMIVTCMNVLLLTMLFQLAVLVIAYIIVGYVMVKSTGWWLATRGWKSLVRRVTYCTLTIYAVLVFYYVNKYHFAMYLSIVIGMLAGGCHLSNTSMIDLLVKFSRKLP